MNTQLTEQQALLKLTTLCTRSEHCEQEMIEKMRKWQLPEDAIARNMDFLVSKKFIDNERFARFFINDKIKYNKWGRRKVEQALWMKRIPKEISDPVFAEIEDELYLETLLPLMKSKYKTIKAKTDYERSVKLIRFALGRGYSMDLIHKCIDLMQVEDIEDVE
jgi:regulatory protein